MNITTIQPTNEQIQLIFTIQYQINSEKLRKQSQFSFHSNEKKNIWTGCCCCSCFQIWHCDYVVKWIESTVQKNPRYWYMAASVCVLYTMFESSLSKWAHPMLQHARICVDWAFVCMCVVCMFGYAAVYVRRLYFSSWWSSTITAYKPMAFGWCAGIGVHVNLNV